VTDTTRSASSLAGKTTYYWRVSARNTSGISAFSAARSFTTSLAVPVLLVPANGATGRQQPVQLRWTSVNGATGYHVQVSTEAGFASGLVVNDAALVDTQRTVSGLQGATLYYWRVAGRDAGGMARLPQHRRSPQQSLLPCSSALRITLQISLRLLRWSGRRCLRQHTIMCRLLRIRRSAVALCWMMRPLQIPRVDSQVSRRAHGSTGA